MSLHLYAYLNVDQEQIDKIIKENKYNIDDSDDIIEICEKYKDLNGLHKNLILSYSYDDDMDFHKLYSYFHINYIKDNNELYIKYLENKYGTDGYLNILNNLINVYTKDDAINMYNAIKRYLSVYEELNLYKEWLLNTSECCDEYEIE